MPAAAAATDCVSQLGKPDRMFPSQQQPGAAEGRLTHRAGVDAEGAAVDVARLCTL